MKRLYDLLYILGRVYMQTKWDSNFSEIQVSSPFKFHLLWILVSSSSFVPSLFATAPEQLIKMLFLTNKSLLIISFEKREETIILFMIRFELK